MLHCYFQAYADMVLLATRFDVRHTQIGTAARLPEHASGDASGDLGGDEVAASNARPCRRARRRASDAEGSED